MTNRNDWRPPAPKKWYAHIGMAYIVMAYVVMAYIVMAYVVMAYIVMACVVCATVMAWGWPPLLLPAGYDERL